MKRLRSYDDDLDSNGDRGVLKDWSRREQDSDHPHRRFYLKAENGRKGLSSSSGYDQSIEDDREVSRPLRKRLDHDSDGFERRKRFDRYRDCGDRGISLSSPRTSYGGERIHRSESFCGSRRDFPKGFRSERERSRRGESVSSWRRLGGSKDCDEDTRFNVDTGRGRRVASEERGNVRSPQGLKDAQKSPPCSKDSGGEQSKSTKVRKNKVHRECGSSSEMEEGELQPEAEATPGPEVDSEHEHKPNPEHEDPEAEPDQNAEIPGVCTENYKEVESAHIVKVKMNLKKGGESSVEDKIEFKGEDNCDEKQEDGRREPVSGVDKEIGEVPEPLGNSNSEFSTRKEAAVGANVGREGKNAKEDCESGGPCVLTPKGQDRCTDEATKDEDAKKPLPLDEEQKVGKDVNAIEGTAGNEGREGESAIEDCASLSPCVLTPEDRSTDEATKDEDAEKSLPSDEELKEGKDINLEGHVKDIDLPNSNPEVANENGTPKVTLNLIRDKPTQYSKDKGKSIAVSSYTEANYMEDSAWIEEDAMEGPSCRGFELFSCPAATRQEKKNDSWVNKQKDKMLKMEPLELSLCLPNVSFELHSHHPMPAPGSPSRTRGVQSVPSTFWTGSDELTASISFSGSQPFVHNPSCSLTQNSLDNHEQSVGSHPIFKGVDKNSPASWLVQLSNEPKYKEVPLYPRILQKGNASLSSQGILKHHTMQVQDHSRNSEGTSGEPVPLDWQSSRSKQLTGVPSRNQDESKNPVHSVGTLEVRQEYNEDKKQIFIEKRGGSLFCSSNQKEIEQLVVGGSDFVERIIAMIILEPAQEMAKRIHEMTEHSITCLKERARDMILNKDNSGQLHTFQEALRSRSDLTLETLSKCNRTQLEILVAFKTGVQDFLYRAKDSHSTDLAEVFLNLKCRNLACRSPLPVDECDCKVCAQKSGFCSACMCLVCSKFDMASNTCSWVGCDVCLHWCHTSCGLRGSHIRNGYSVTGAPGTTEMQFHCLACNHPSEMFGFVKEVFKTCAREWEVETLSKELEYVKRIFSVSNDVQGKQLHNLAEKMHAKLENDKFSLSEVYNQIMEFLTETDSKLANTSTTEKEQSGRNLGLGSGVLGPSQEAMWLTSFSTEKINPQTVNIGNGARSMVWDREGRLNEDSQLQKSAEKKPVFDELESIVRIKQAEAKMFQTRADDARREAEGLKLIAVTKNDKIEADYGSRIAKVRLAESEERRRQKLKELQILERSLQEYINMKMRMETEIQDMLLRMDDAKRNIGS